MVIIMTFNSFELNKAAITNLSSAPSTVLTIGEFRVRYPNTTANGNLQIQSSTSTPVSFVAYSQEFYTVSYVPNNRFLSTVAPAAGGLWITLNAGGMGVNELNFHDIFTQNAVYKFENFLYDSTTVHIIGKMSI